MRTLYRLRLRPTSPWRTPWQADTLYGLLCWACARSEGPAALREAIVAPALEGRPAFVLSDAFPGDWLPAPLALRLHPWPAEQRKRVKRARWLAYDDFERARRGFVPPADALREDPWMETARQHNTLGRGTDAAGEEGGLFARPEWLLDPRARGAGGGEFLSVYFRCRDDFADRLVGLFEALSEGGFGADAATGRGQFELSEGPERVSGLDAAPAGADGVIALSTFQPAAGDSTDGVWEAFTKFGKLGPDYGLDNRSAAKNPLVLLRPGACFRGEASRPFLGRAVPMRQLLPAATADALRARGVELIHPAFGLAVPAALKWD